MSQSRKRREDEDACFVCFDGGTLALCDRRGCPKDYHPTCVKRNEAFFIPRAKWNCDWHICTACQKDSSYICYTCPYSVCKRCVRSSEEQSTKAILQVIMDEILNDPKDRIEIAQSHAFYRPSLLDHS